MNFELTCEKMYTKIVFLSNYYNHHQAPFSEAMNQLTRGNYTFVETEPMTMERKNMGWGEDKLPNFVTQLYKSDNDLNNCKKLIEDADLVIIGSANKELIKDRLKSKKLVFIYSERWYKTGFQWWKWPVRICRHYLTYGRFKNSYMLCASAYTAADCAKTRLFLNKTYKWGYFPAFQKYNDIEKLVSNKKSASILWVGRLIEWKHPDVSIYVAEKLKKEGYKFSLDIIGNGELEQSLKTMVTKKGLTDCVRFLGSMRPDEVRKHMEQSQIFLFTSDFNEGWGAVLNESMNSACAVVASHAIGAVPFLIDDGKNGVIYENGNKEQLLKKVKYLLEYPEECKRLGEKAYYSIADCWNANMAAERLLELIDDLQKNGKSDRFISGPCSKAPVVSDGWYKTNTKS